MAVHVDGLSARLSFIKMGSTTWDTTQSPTYNLNGIFSHEHASHSLFCFLPPLIKNYL